MQCRCQCRPDTITTTNSESQIFYYRFILKTSSVQPDTNKNVFENSCLFRLSLDLIFYLKTVASLIRRHNVRFSIRRNCSMMQTHNVLASLRYKNKFVCFFNAFACCKLNILSLLYASRTTMMLTSFFQRDAIN